ncbi:hypothetical protein M3I53_26485 [Paraburkholderia sp. CNPSo 3272]|uniref:hypothetical protein n=1 Tax=Paraburkholderia sp. CNPSo 3272 TaxID=2940931 RepID=UPI0020B6F83C|nr:hypothetical protein [Paraburkholderia sp. CNPSo 3272]MCP3726635.1 hypothetical protein [Paraburkholderia sp. CNPSo 3272]
MPDLAVWHTYVPREMTVKEMDAGDWNAYMNAEARIFQAVRVNVVEKPRNPGVAAAWRSA